jgi:hypothetical protein
LQNGLKEHNGVRGKVWGGTLDRGGVKLGLYWV